MSYEVARRGTIETLEKIFTHDLRECVLQELGYETAVDTELVWYVGEERDGRFEMEVLERLNQMEWFESEWNDLPEVFAPKPIDPKDYKREQGREAFVLDKASELAADTARFELSGDEEPVFYWEMDRRDDGRFYPRIGNTEASWLEQCGVESKRCALEKLAVWELEQGFASGKDYGFWLSPEGRGYTDGGISVYLREGEILRCWSTLQPVDEQAMMKLCGVLHGVAEPVRDIHRIDDLRVNPYMGSFDGRGEDELWDYLETEAVELDDLWRFMRSGKAKDRSERARVDVEAWAERHFDEFVRYDTWQDVGTFGVGMEEYFEDLGWEQRTGGGDACSSLYSVRVASMDRVGMIVDGMDDIDVGDKQKMTEGQRAQVVALAKEKRGAKVPGYNTIDLWSFNDHGEPVAKYMVQCPFCHKGLGYVGLDEVECRHCTEPMNWQVFLC